METAGKEFFQSINMPDWEVLQRFERLDNYSLFLDSVLSRFKGEIISYVSPMEVEKRKEHVNRICKLVCRLLDKVSEDYATEPKTTLKNIWRIKGYVLFQAREYLYSEGANFPHLSLNQKLLLLHGAGILENIYNKYSIKTQAYNFIAVLIESTPEAVKKSLQRFDDSGWAGNDTDVDIVELFLPRARKRRRPKK